MFVFLADHSNWDILPLLPQQQGCPELEFTPPQFLLAEWRWQIKQV